MKNYKIILALLSFTASTFLFSCSKSSTNDLHDVQLCLNKATADTAMGCVDKISSDTSALAYNLRCSAIFISQGFGDASSFVDALASINNSGNCTGGCSSTVNVLYSLNFTKGDVTTLAGRKANNDAAAEAFVQCSQSDAKIYTQIASIFRLGTLTSMLAYAASGTSTINEDDIKTALASGQLSASDVGAIVVVTAGNACANTDKASDSTKAYCSELQAAIDGGTTEAQIGACLIAKLQDPADPGHVCQ